MLIVPVVIAVGFRNRIPPFCVLLIKNPVRSITAVLLLLMNCFTIVLPTTTAAPAVQPVCKVSAELTAVFPSAPLLVTGFAEQVVPTVVVLRISISQLVGVVA